MTLFQKRQRGGFRLLRRLWRAQSRADSEAMKREVAVVYGLLVVTALVVTEGRAMKPIAEIAITRGGEEQLSDIRVFSGAKREDSPLGGGVTVLATYYVEVKVNGQKLRLQVVRRISKSKALKSSLWW